jgi:hypothetical protein
VKLLILSLQLKDFRFHDLRHTFASWYMMNGGDLYAMAKILGHSNIKMTERYAKRARQHIVRTSGTARELWKFLEPQCANAATLAEECSRIVRARKFECFWATYQLLKLMVASLRSRQTKLFTSLNRLTNFIYHKCQA